MKVITNIKGVVKGENYIANVVSYNDALCVAKEIANNLEASYKDENSYLDIHIMPFTKGQGGYCVKVWMQYSDMTAAEDTRVEIYFCCGWFGAARKAVMERKQQREQLAEVLNIFGF